MTYDAFLRFAINLFPHALVDGGVILFYPGIGER